MRQAKLFLSAWLLAIIPIFLVVKSPLDTTRPETKEGGLYFRKTVGGALFLIFIFLTSNLRQRDLEFVIEPDFNFQLIESWRRFFFTFSAADLYKPIPYVYLDGQFIVYALVASIMRWLTAHLTILGTVFPNDVSYVVGAVLITNIIAYASACTIFYAALCRMTGCAAISALMALGLFLTPQMIDINMMRVDFFVTLPLIAIFYCSVVLAVGMERTWHAVALGLAMAFAATLKINGPIFGLFPALAALTAFSFERATIRRLALFSLIGFAAFLPAYIALMGRYFYFLTATEFVQIYTGAINELRKWAPYMVGSPWYYNVDLMLDSGVPFIAVYLLCAVVVLFMSVTQKYGSAIFLVLSFVTFSALGIASQKYSRGGYHLLPIFFAMIGLAAATLLKSPTNRVLKAAGAASIGAVLAYTLHISFAKYQAVVTARKTEYLGIQAIIRLPRDWLQSHIPAGTTVCVLLHSNWSLPPLDGFRVINGPLTIPYLDPVALPQSYPPSLEGAKKACPIIVTSDYHRDMYIDLMNKMGAPNPASEWKKFFASLSATYPTTVFSSPTPVYAREIIINDLRDVP